MEKLLNLNELGLRIREVDEMIMTMIVSRMDLVAQVGDFKRPKRLDVVRRGIEDSRIEEMKAIGRPHGICDHLVGQIFYALINESCKVQLEEQERIAREKSDQKPADDPYPRLKRNLLRLTEAISASYDEKYSSGFFATREYLDFEGELLGASIKALEVSGTLLDLGCATGRVSLGLAPRFDRTVGYDISQHMVYEANQKAEILNLENKATFLQRDLEDGIPEDNDSASFVVMNLGTASDMRDIERVLSETMRVLKPGGRFLFSFYNANALLYRWGYLPWRTDMAASININRHCLEVRLAGEMFSIYARPYSVTEVEELFQKHGVRVDTVTFPTVGAIMPSAVFKNQPETKDSITEIDRSLANLGMGAYIVATGQKE